MSKSPGLRHIDENIEAAAWEANGFGRGRPFSATSRGTKEQARSPFDRSADGALSANVACVPARSELPANHAANHLVNRVRACADCQVRSRIPNSFTTPRAGLLKLVDVDVFHGLLPDASRLS
jgi:hypothetical protein